MQDNYIFKLSDDYVKFEPVSNDNIVFFDDHNQQVFILKNDGSQGIEVKSPTSHFKLNLTLEDVTNIKSIKLSPSSDILALQRCGNSVEFFVFDNEDTKSVFTQTCKSKTSTIIGYVWTSGNEIVFVTDSGVEYFEINRTRNCCRHLKSFNITINWFIYQPVSSFLILSSSQNGNLLQPFHFKSSTMYKLTKFEVEWSAKLKNQRPCLYERDVAVVNLYNQTFLLVLQHEAVTKEEKGSQISIYTLQKEGPARKTHILQLRLTGRFAINIVDNLVVVHHKTSQASLMFDIKSPSGQIQSGITYLSPILQPSPIEPFEVDDSTLCELYSTNWAIFQPDIIIDAKLGYFWKLKVNLIPICSMMSNDGLLLDFLLPRSNSKQVILNLCKEEVCRRPKEFSNINHLGKIGFIFNKLNSIYRDNGESSKSLICKQIVENDAKTSPYIDQTDMFSSVFSVFEVKSEDSNENFVVSVLFEYIYSLNRYKIPVQYLIYELLINVLVRGKKFYLLHQFLQYQVLTPSKQLACLLLSLQPHYPHATQLALDMFQLLQVSQEHVIDILLSRYDIFRAIRFIQNNGNPETISAKKFLEVALSSGDDQLFFNTFRFFEQRNFRLRGSPTFLESDLCEPFVGKFEEMFGKSSSF
ncbi:regulator of MON1-CCZ1 complex [Tetranychus urticae]|uniref:Uncharacterized protein n=1 Tax=Tetranychus urticae TaxID=32264 RepID=T1K5V2_TETUR|nr:regulator of MON1-CCZ1 complex [Tetranychus urticae]